MCSGKTYLINQWLREQNRYVRFDVTGETLDEAGIEHIWHSPTELYDRLNDEKRMYYFRIAYHPGQDIESDFRYCAEILWRVPVSKMLVCDEMHEIFQVNQTPRYAKTLMRYARHNQFAIIGASQRIADVDKLFTAGCRQIILFWTQEARDYDAIKDRWGKEVAETVRNLRPLIYDDTTGVTSQVPQCVVVSKARKPFVYDFQNDSEAEHGESNSGISDEEDGSMEETTGAREDESELPGS